LPYYRFVSGTLADVPDVMISRTGYSGELGFELFFPTEYSDHFWERITDAGQAFGPVPCGLAALASLRMEKKYPLYGLDLDLTVNPFEASLVWTVRLDKGNFFGRDALARIKAAGASRALVLLALDNLDAVMTRVDLVLLGERAIGTVTSAAKGHFVGKSLAMALIDSVHASGTTQFAVRLQLGMDAPAQVFTTAIHDPDRLKLRG
jgi:aminomethyltransferase